MKNSIYISNDYIQVLGYQRKKGESSLTVEQYIREPIPDETVFNGIITDRSALYDTVSRLVDEHPALFKGASLTLDTNAILTKKISVPKLTREQAITVAREEIGSNAGTYEELIYDAATFPEKTGQYLLGCAIEKSAVDSYVSIFQQAGVSLDAIHIGLELIIQHVKRTPELCEGSVAICLLDGVSLLSTIFTDGDYMFSTRARIVGDEQPEVVRELLANLTSIVQFNKQIQGAYYLGIEEDTLSLMRELKYENIEASLYRLDLRKDCNGGGILGSDCHFAVLGAMKEEKSINLLKTAQKGGAGGRAAIKFNRFQAVCGAAVLSIVVLFGILLFHTYRNNTEIAQMQTYLQNPDNLAAMERSTELEGQMEQLMLVRTQLDIAEALVETYPAVTPEMLSWLFDRAGNVRIQQLQFDAATRALRLTYTCATELDSSSYVESIKGYEDFESTVYTGYSAQSESGYTFEIAITLKEKVTAPVEELPAEDSEPPAAENG